MKLLDKLRSKEQGPDSPDPQIRSSRETRENRVNRDTTQRDTRPGPNTRRRYLDNTYHTPRAPPLRRHLDSGHFSQGPTLATEGPSPSTGGRSLTLQLSPLPDHDLDPVVLDLVDPLDVRRPRSLSTTATLDSTTTALSDLTLTFIPGSELQPTYSDNFTASHTVRRRRPPPRNAADDFTDDAPTMVLVPEQAQVMAREVGEYTHKRRMVLVAELLWKTHYLFASPAAFETFLDLRLKRKSMLGEPRRSPGLLADPPDSSYFNQAKSNIIPPPYKATGLGLPLFKISFPRLALFRKDSPFVVFRRYHEVMPADSETYTFATVLARMLGGYVRFMFHFTPADAPEFRVVAIQSNIRPFTDFTYKDTRFRLLGTAIGTPFLTFVNPCMRLLVLDQAQVSLTDDLVEKPLGPFWKRKPRPKPAPAPPDTLLSPMVNPENPLHVKLAASPFPLTCLASLHPHCLPPFGKYLEATTYLGRQSLIPRKFTEAGSFEVYEPAPTTGDKDSTYSVDTDSLVLAAIIWTLRELGLAQSVQKKTISNRRSPSDSFLLTSSLRGVTNII